MTTGHALVDAISEIAFEGHVIPWSWFRVLRFDNGKPDLSAIMILADIVFWYRPSPILCEETGTLLGHKKRFKADLLQRSYQSWADQFGLTKRQATEAIIRLEKTYKVIKRHFRTIDTTNGRAANVLFIEPCPEHIRAITHQRETCPVRMGHLPRLNGTPPTSQRETNTETTTETTQRKNTPPVSPVGETSPALTPASLVTLYNTLTPADHPKVSKLTPARAKKAKRLLHTFPERGFWEGVFREIEQSPLLLGHKPTPAHPNFRGDFDWLLAAGKDGTENCVKVAEGKYRESWGEQALRHVGTTGLHNMQVLQSLLIEEEQDNG